ncbi:hypothetical protein SAMN02910436_02969 [Ruminococcaceae bacterium P7]|nr:hypothetical protein SAMN02910436_02969 [Ruminococcaceae bacterium P7]
MSNTNKATLSLEERKTFFRLFIPLLDFTNQKYEINEYLSEDLRLGNPDTQDLKEVADILWANLETIDEYIEATEEQFGLDECERRLLESWREPITGRFILERHLAKGSVFIDTEDTEIMKVYLVKGLTEPWSEMLADFSPPIFLKATLIPFGNCIISDGLVYPHKIIFSSGARSDFKDFYMNAKQSGKIITSL